MVGMHAEEERWVDWMACLSGKVPSLLPLLGNVLI